MSFLGPERATLRGLIPRLDETLMEVSLDHLEEPGSPAIQIFRDCHGPCLLVPEKLGGKGASPLDAIRVHRAIASRAPSLAVAMTMHNFSVATFVEYSLYGGEGDALLEAIAGDQLLVASGFAEGRSGTSILAAQMTADRVPGGYRLNGSKKPCSLSRSMDVLTASVGVRESNGAPRRAVAMIPAAAAGIERRPFWRSPVLAGAESDELVLRNVYVAEECVFFPESNGSLDRVELGGFCWFEALVSATYLGIASALVERALKAGKGDPGERALLGIELEAGMAALEGVARAMMAGDRDGDVLARILCVRYAIQEAIERAAARAAELLGGMAFVSSPHVSYLLAASRALAFHPPSRVSMASALAGYLIGEPIQTV